jgi:hypothetical protein
MDRKLDPEGEDLLPIWVEEIREKVVEIHAMRATESQHNREMPKGWEQRDIEAEELCNAARNSDDGMPSVQGEGEDTLADILGKISRGEARPLQEANRPTNISVINCSD